MMVCHYVVVVVVDFIELFPNSNLRRFDSLSVITLCRRATLDESLEQTADDGLLVNVCKSLDLMSY